MGRIAYAVVVAAVFTSAILCSPVLRSPVSERQRRAVDAEVEQKIRSIINHFKQPDPVGLPGAVIPDPLPIPLRAERTIAGVNFKFRDARVVGLSTFRLDHVRSDLSKLQFSAGFTFNSLSILGHYEMSYWFSESEGMFNVSLTGVQATGFGGLQVSENGTIQISDITMDITFESINVAFENLGFLASMFQGIVNLVGDTVFDMIKPFILEQVNTNVRQKVNARLQQIPGTPLFPDSISILDVALYHVRTQIRGMKYDPMTLPDVEKSKLGLNFHLTDGQLSGLSSVHRVGDMEFSFEDNTAAVTLHVGTQRLKGKYAWTISGLGFLSRSGMLSFSIDGIDILLTVAQSANVEHSPQLRTLDITLGTIQLRSDGAGTLDYILEFAVNVFPNLFSNIVLDAIEPPLRWIIQANLNKIDVEKIILDRISKRD